MTPQEQEEIEHIILQASFDLAKAEADMKEAEFAARNSTYGSPAYHQALADLKAARDQRTAANNTLTASVNLLRTSLIQKEK